ncbi:hypothetical protein BH18ACT1_BH18ACT1_14160 [soil metagenome]
MTCAGWFVVTQEAGPTEEVGGDGRRLSERCRPDRWDSVQPERGGPFKSGAARDLGVIGVLVLLAALALIQFEPGEHLARSSLYESLELDEAPFLALIALAGLGAFAIRRWLEASRQARRAGEAAQALRHQDEERTVEAERQRFERRLHGALDMAATESAALSVAERALEEGAPEAPVELLLADSSNSHLGQAGVHGPRDGWARLPGPDAPALSCHPNRAACVSRAAKPSTPAPSSGVARTAPAPRPARPSR